MSEVIGDGISLGFPRKSGTVVGAQSAVGHSAGAGGFYPDGGYLRLAD